MHNATTTQVEFKVGLSFLEIFIGTVMSAVACYEKPAFSIVVKAAAAGRDRTNLTTTVKVGVHLFFQVLHLTCLHLYRIHQRQVRLVDLS